jgi:tetratricopeptide (TPR) repeat protein
MPAEHSGQMTQEARHTGFGLRADLPIQSLVILFRADVGPVERQGTKRGDWEALALGFFDNAVAYGDRSEWRLALEFFNRTLSIFKEKLGHRKGEAGALHGISVALYQSGEWEQALTFFTEALEIFKDKEVGDRKGEANALYNIGLAHYELDDLQQALTFFTEALEIFKDKEVGDRKGEANALYNIGSAHDRSGEWQQAVKAYIQTLPIYKEVGNRAGVAFALAQLKRIKALYAKSLDKSRPDALPSGDTQEQGGKPTPDGDQASETEPPKLEGRMPMPEHMDVDSQRLVELFEQLPPARKKRILAQVETEVTFRQNAHAVLPPAPTPEEIAEIPKWRGRKIDGMPTDFLKTHYGRWLKRFDAPEDRVYQDQIRHHNFGLIRGLQNQLREAGEGERVSDYLPTRSTRIDDTVKNDPEVVKNDPRIGAALSARARRAAELQASI